MMKNFDALKSSAAILLLIGSTWFSIVAQAAIPKTIDYQGFLTDQMSLPVNATLTMVFKLYAVPTGGTALHTESQSVTVTAGAFNAILGTSPLLTLPFDAPYYVGITVGTDAEMTPRQPLVASPYAIRAAGLDATAVLPTTQLSGTVATAQIAANAVTQTKLSPVAAPAAGSVLGTNGTTLQWQAPTAGTVTSITAGSGLTGGVITASGTIAADTAYLQRRVAGACAVGSYVRAVAADGTVTCGTDAGGTLTSITAGAGLTGGTVTTSGTIAVDPASSTLTGNYFRLGGNATATTAQLGTTNLFPVDVIVNNQRAKRLEFNALSPIITGGHSANTVTAGASGGVIGGGGAAGNQASLPTSGVVNCYLGVFTPVLCANKVTDAYGVVGGGLSNQAGDGAGAVDDRSFATVTGGFSNAATGRFAMIGGGSYNVASGLGSFVGGGDQHVAAGDSSTVGGGNGNHTDGYLATIAGGQANSATGNGSFIGGGYQNQTTQIYSTVAGGTQNMASGMAAFAAGELNVASGANSVALGRRAVVNGAGSFLFADSTTENNVLSNSPNEFAVVATGGIALATTRTFTNVCRLAPGGGSWACVSDRNAKKDFAKVDARDVLNKVTTLPITTWRFKTQPDTVRHMGPMAQDFRAAFGLGTDDISITQVDINGVTLAAIQGLHQILIERDAMIERLAGRISDLEMNASRSASLERRIAQLESSLDTVIAAKATTRHALHVEAGR